MVLDLINPGNFKEEGEYLKSVKLTFHTGADDLARTIVPKERAKSEKRRLARVLWSLALSEFTREHFLAGNTFFLAVNYVFLLSDN
jgi:hypothetical protein